jgi:hypothetical protein
MAYLSVQSSPFSELWTYFSLDSCGKPYRGCGHLSAETLIRRKNASPHRDECRVGSRYSAALCAAHVGKARSNGIGARESEKAIDKIVELG